MIVGLVDIHAKLLLQSDCPPRILALPDKGVREFSSIGIVCNILRPEPI